MQIVAICVSRYDNSSSSCGFTHIADYCYYHNEHRSSLFATKKREPFDSRFVPPQVVPIMPCVQGQPDFWNMVWSWSSKNVASPNHSRNSLFYIIFSKYPLYDNILCILALIICLDLMLYNFYSRV